MPRQKKTTPEALDALIESVKKTQASARQVIEETKAWLAEQEASPARRGKQ